MAYRLLATPRAQRELDALPRRIQDGLRMALQVLAEEQRAKRFDLKELHGGKRKPPYLRLRIGDYRVLLQIDHAAGEVRVGRVGHRRDVYRGLPLGYD